MPRNLDRRVEVVVPISDSLSRGRIQGILDVCLADDVLAWELGADGSWSRVPTKVGLNSHRRFQELALERARSNGAASRVTHG
jgi:polyphosphate kinase